MSKWRSFDHPQFVVDVGTKIHYHPKKQFGDVLHEATVKGIYLEFGNRTTVIAMDHELNYEVLLYPTQIYEAEI